MYEREGKRRAQDIELYFRTIERLKNEGLRLRQEVNCCGPSHSFSYSSRAGYSSRSCPDHGDSQSADSFSSLRGSASALQVQLPSGLRLLMPRAWEKLGTTCLGSSTEIEKSQFVARVRMCLIPCGQLAEGPNQERLRAPGQITDRRERWP